MKVWTALFVLIVVSILVTSPSVAEDVTGKDEILCTTTRVKECFADGGCVEGPPATWNLPRFTRIDLAKKVLETTEASGQNRSTPIEYIERQGDGIALQGAEGGKAFTILLETDTGTASLAIALEGSVLVGFGYCTPLEDD